MEKLSAQKKLNVVRGYLSGLSYDENAVKYGVSKGAVANIVEELKSGKFPEAASVIEYIEQLRELSLDLKRTDLTPGKCALGLAVLTRIKECGLDPADIDRWPLILKSIANEEDGQQFVSLVYSIQEVQERTGLSLDALDNKAHELEKNTAELKPISDKVAECKKQFAELSKQKKELSGEVANLEERYKLLNPQVKELEARKKVLSGYLAETEPKAEEAGATLTNLDKQMQKLEHVGFTIEDLAVFTQKVKEIAKRHGIKTGDLRSRLLHELEILDKGLGLEVLIKNKKLELSNVVKDIASNNRELETTKAAVSSLKQEKANLEAGIKETREYVSQEIARIIPVARNTLAQLTKELQTGVANALAGVSQLRDKSLEAGKEVGRCQEIIETNVWLKGMLALVKGEQGIEAKQVKAIALMVARGIAVWLKTQDKNHYSVFSLSVMLDNLIKELEEWKV